MTSQPHHLANITSHGGETREQKAAHLFLTDYGSEDIAVELFGKDDGFTLSATRQILASEPVRKLIEQGRAKSLGAH